MKILILVATENEIFRENFSDCSILIGGVGMINTTYELTNYLSKNSADFVINLGIAGSFKKDLVVGTVCEVIHDTLSELGVENKEEFLTLNQVGFNTQNAFMANSRTSLINVSSITVNTVHGNKKSISNISQRLNAGIETMEGAACMMVCEKFNIPCLQIRSISNFIEERNKENWDIPLAVKNLNSVAREIISNL
jgi:futalosine hydrolase